MNIELVHRPCTARLKLMQQLRIQVDALRRVEAEDGDVGDDELLGHDKSLSDSDLASGPSDAPHGLIRLSDAIIGEWKALAA